MEKLKKPLVLTKRVEIKQPHGAALGLYIDGEILETLSDLEEFLVFRIQSLETDLENAKNQTNRASQTEDLNENLFIEKLRGY